uniref:Transcription repressor n=2 Tax=Oryza brachyantha TaxID=4533 RepID=J3M2U1_ORYBR
MSDSLRSTSEPAAVNVNDDDDDEEVIIRGLRSSNRRLFFEPDSTSSIVVKGRPAAAAAAAAFDGATAMSIDSADPYGDFRRSMEEMVMSHMNGGAHDWGWLEEMLGWYLRANGKKTHGLIVGAFVDLVVALASPPSSAAACSSSSAFLPLQAAVKKGSQIN